MLDMMLRPLSAAVSVALATAGALFIAPAPAQAAITCDVGEFCAYQYPRFNTQPGETNGLANNWLGWGPGSIADYRINDKITSVYNRTSDRWKLCQSVTETGTCAGRVQYIPAGAAYLNLSNHMDNRASWVGRG